MAYEAFSSTQRENRNMRSIRNKITSSVDNIYNELISIKFQHRSKKEAFSAEGARDLSMFIQRLGLYWNVDSRIERSHYSIIFWRGLSK